MTATANDSDFRKLLNGLSLVQQRAVGARFVHSVKDLSDDTRIDVAIKVAQDSKATNDDIDSAYKSANRAVMDCYTRCGADADWDMQASYFVARAASDVVTPEKEIKNNNPAWQAAMHSRMARTCAVIDTDTTEEQQETEQQHRILDDFLND
jgi:3'-phosphoadenosine 5'-phosphosulfate (PAPS) 3'-phosphatase